MSKAKELLEKFQHLGAKTEADVSNLGQIPDKAKAEPKKPEEEKAEGPSISGETTSDGAFPHQHGFTIDSKGNGKTTSTVGKGEDHEHTIETFNVQSGGDPEHTHDILEEDVDGDGKPDESLGAFQEYFPKQYDWSRWTGSSPDEDISEKNTEKKDSPKEVTASSLMNKFI